MEVPAVPRGETSFLETLSGREGVIGFASYFIGFLGWWNPGAFGYAFERGIDPSLGGGVTDAGNHSGSLKSGASRGY